MPAQTPVSIAVATGQVAYIGTTAPPPAAPSFALTGPATAVAGVSQNYTLTGSNLVPGQNYVGSLVSGDPGMVDTPSEVTLTSVSPAAVVGVLFAAVGAQTLKGLMASGTESNQLAVNVSPAPSPPPPPPPPAPTTATLSLASTGTAGVAISGAVTLDAAAASNTTANLSVTGGSLSTTSPVVLAGTTSIGFTATPSTAGVDMVVTLNSTSPALTVAGSPRTVTVSAGASVSAPGGFTLLASSTGTHAFSVGFAFEQGAIPSGSGIVINGAATHQATVKNRWPDNSVKFAILAGTAALTSGTPLALTPAAGTASTGPALTTTDLQAAITSAAVDAGAFGSATFSGSDWTSPFATWVSGHRMSSWIYRKQVGSDAHLVAWLEVRLYAGGAVEILPWIENGYVNVASPNTRAATYTFSINGSSRFSAAITLYSRTRTPLLSGSAVSHWVGTAPDVIVKHDSAYLAKTGLVPSYGTIIDPSHAQVTGLPSSYTPLQQGAFESSLDTGGFHNGVCMLPQWDALHLASSATSTYKAVVFQAYSAGRYAFHLRDEATNLPLRINDPAYATASSSTIPAPGAAPAQAWSYDHQPSVGYLAYLLTGAYYHMETCQFVASGNFLLGSSASARNNGDGVFTERFNVRAQAWGVRGLVYACTVTPDADVGSLRTAYLAALTNNINYYWSRYINQTHNPFGFINGPVGSNKWGPYNLNLNATPTGGTTTTIEFADSAFQSDQAGASSYIGQKIAVGVSAPGDHHPTITGWTRSGGTLTFTVSPAMSGPPGAFACELIPLAASDAPWMQDYSIATWGQMKSAELVSGTTETRREAFWLWHAGQIVGRMGRWGSGEYLYRDCSPYVIATGPVNQTTFQGPNWDTGAGPWYADWAEVYAATYVASGGATGQSYLLPLNAGGSKAEGPMRSSGFADGDTAPQQSQFANSMRAIAYVVRHGVPGAEAGFQRITSSQNYHLFLQNMETAGYAQGALSPYVMPAWWRGVAVNQWIEIAGSSMSGSPLAQNSNVVRDQSGNAYGKETADGGRLDSYCGMTVDTRRSTLWTVAGGGHGDYFGNELVKQDLLADEPVWEIHFAGSNGNVMDTITPSGNPSLARYSDGMPCSRHTYGQSMFLERHNRAVTTGGSISFPGTGYQDTEAYDVDATTSAGWAAQYAYPGGQGGTGSSASSGSAAIAATACKDPTTEIIYTFGSTRLHKLTPSYDGPTASASSGATYSYSPLTWDSAYPYSEGAAAVDTKRNRILWTNGYGIGAYRYEIGAGTTTAVTYSGAAASALAAESASGGLVYVPRLDAYLYRGKAAGGGVYSITADTFVATSLSTTGGSSVPAQVGSGSGGPGYGVYNKWQFVPHLRGCVYIAGANHNTWFLRLY